MKYLVITISMFFFGVNYSSAQGCSDAGFCTIGSHFNQFQEDSTTFQDVKQHWFKFTPTIGLGEEGILHFVPTLEAKYSINKRFAVQARLPIQANFGDLANNTALGNLVIMGSTELLQKDNMQFYLNFGTSISLGSANQTKNGLPLPMAHQSNLGTLDALIVLNYKVKHFSLATGIQQPIINYNENTFLPETYANQPNMDIANRFPATNDFYRKGDFLLRADYSIVIKQKAFITPGILFLYHLKNDQYIDSQGKKQTIVGSQGTTLNLTAGFNYRVSNASSFGVNAGFPVITRTVRPDGLTRSLVVSPFYQFNF